MVPELRKRAPVALARAGAAQGAALDAAIVWRKLQREAFDDAFQLWILPQLIQHVGRERTQRLLQAVLLEVAEPRGHQSFSVSS